MLTTLLFLGCHGETPVPEGAWENVAPAVVRSVEDSDVGVLASVEEADWSFVVLLPEGLDVAPGEYLLLGSGPEVQVADLTALDIDEVEVVSAEVAALASSVPDLPADVRSVASLHGERAELDGQAVKAGGRIVKASMDVFDTNWYHLRDGTGSADDEDHDLTFTSDAELSVGDAVVLDGPLTADLDLGFGYFYAAILQGPAVYDLDGALLAEASDAAVIEGRPSLASKGSSRPSSAPEKPSTHVAPTLPTYGSSPEGASMVQPGLELGVATDDDVDRWLDGMRCDRAPALARRTVHTNCRSVAGRWDGELDNDILVVRSEEADAIHHVSVTRRHDGNETALADLTATLERLEARLGTPHEAVLPDAGTVPEGAMMYRATWRFDDLEVVASASRPLPSSPPLVRERWELPGIEASLPDRGVGVHGAGIRSAPNPHRVAD